MDRIAFLISDLSMQQMVHTILDTYKEKLEQHHFIIDVEIIDFPNLVAQAHALVEKGTKVIITTSGAHQILTKAIDTIPILCLYSSTNDALYALRAIAPNYKKIHLLLNENFMFNKEACPPELSEKIVFYPRYSLDKTHLELLERVRQIPVTADTAIVGCPLLPQIANPSPMPIYPIKPSESTMLSVLLYAQELLSFKEKDNQQLSMMSYLIPRHGRHHPLFHRRHHFPSQQKGCRLSGRVGDDEKYPRYLPGLGRREQTVLPRNDHPPSALYPHRQLRLLPHGQQLPLYHDPPRRHRAAAPGKKYPL